MTDWKSAGLDKDPLMRYVEEQVYTLPGADDPRACFTVLLTGSRARGLHADDSDVDIDVLCPDAVYRAVHRESLAAGIIKSPDTFGLVSAPESGWEAYFGASRGRPHFSVTSLADVRRHFDTYTDPWLWVWLNARVIVDPEGQFQRIRSTFGGYPSDVLVRKVKYHWLLAGYWSICVTPLHDTSDDSALAASTAILNTVTELLKLCFLLDGKPLPYAGKLMTLIDSTTLGRQFKPMFQHAVDLVLGKTADTGSFADRVARAFAMFNDSENCQECKRFEAAFFAKMSEIGVPADWLEADFKNIDDLLLARLGPAPE